MSKFAFFLVAIPLLAQNPFTDALKGSYGRVKLNLIETADVMPEADYAFKLTPAQRSFGEWIGHTALSAYNGCSAMQGAAQPEAAKALHDLKAKADLQRALKESFDYCDAAFKSLDDKKASTEVSTGTGNIYPATSMVGLVGGLNEHYGNLVGYMRSKGVVPPSSARAMKKK